MCNYFYIELYDYYSNFVAKIIIVLFGLLYRLEISLVIDPEILRQGEEPALVGGVGAGAGHIPLAPFHLHPPPLRQGGGGRVLLGMFKNGSLLFYVNPTVIHAAQTVMCTFFN